MILYDKILLSIIFTSACFIQAIYQADKFKRHILINHLVHGAIYASFCFSFSLVYWISFGGWKGFLISLKVGGIGLLARAAFFDPILNKLRHYPFWYNSTVTTKPGSFLDWIENKLLLKHTKYSILSLIVLKILYVVCFFVYIILIKW